MGNEEKTGGTKLQSVSSKDDDKYVSEYDWINIRKKMEEGVQPETFLSKLNRKFGENPLVPIGAFATFGALSLGLWNFRLGKKKMSQMMMRARIVAQGFTVVALISGMFMAASATKSQGSFLTSPADMPIPKNKT